MKNWIDNHVKDTKIGGNTLMTVTYDPKEEIKDKDPKKEVKIREYQACYVFSPSKYTDRNKVSLSLLPGVFTLRIGKIETIL